MAIVTLTQGSTSAGRQFANMFTAWAAIPADCVAAGNSYVIESYNDAENFITSKLTLNGKNTDAAHTITWRAASGQGFANNPNVLTNQLAYIPANGVAFVLNVGGNTIDVKNDWMTIEGIQFRGIGSGSSSSINLSVAPNSVIQNCIIEHFSTGTDSYAMTVVNGTVRNMLILLQAAQSYGIRIYQNTTTMFENITFVRPSTYARGYSAFRQDYGTGTGFGYRNCCCFGMDLSWTANSVIGSNNASDGAIGFGSNNLQNLVAANQFVDPAGDFRLKPGSVLIDAGTTPGASNTRTVSGIRQQGTAADIGVWEVPSSIVAPTAQITGFVVNSATQTATLSGTTSGNPTLGVATLAAAPIAYNKAVGQGPLPITLNQDGTFTITFSSLMAGSYVPTLSFSNSSFSTIATNSFGTVNIIGPFAASVIQDPIDGGVLTVHGTTGGSPTSGQFILPASSNSAGAQQQTVPVTLNQDGTFTVSVIPVPGNYDGGILTFSNAKGTSLPQTGTSGISILGISGNPQATVDTTPTVAPTAIVTSQSMDGTTLTITGTTTGTPTSATVSLTASGGGTTNLGPVAVTLSPGSFTVSITGLVVGGVYTPVLTFTNATGPNTASGAQQLTVQSVSTALTLSGPSSGVVSTASSLFTVGSNGNLGSTTVTVTPSDGGKGGEFSPVFVMLTGTQTKTFVYTPPATPGSYPVSLTNNGSLANPSAAPFTASAIAGSPSLVLSADPVVLGRRVTASGVVDFQGDSNGSLSSTLTLSNGTIIGPTAVSVTNGTWSYNYAKLVNGNASLVFVATANGRTVTITKALTVTKARSSNSSILMVM